MNIRRRNKIRGVRPTGKATGKAKLQERKEFWETVRVVAIMLIATLIIGTILYFVTGYTNHSYYYPKCTVEHDSFMDYMQFHYGGK